MKRWLVLLTVVAVAGCSGGPKRGTGLRLVTFDEPVKAELKESPTLKRYPVKPVEELTRAGILRIAGKSKQDAEEVAKVLKDSSASAGEFWTGERFLFDAAAYEEGDLNWGEGLTVTPNKPVVMPSSGPPPKLSLYCPMVSVYGADFNSTAQYYHEDYVNINLDHVAVSYMNPEKVVLCHVSIDAPPAQSVRGADAYLVHISMEMTGQRQLRDPFDEQRLILEVDRRQVPFSVSDDGIVALVNLSGGRHEFWLFGLAAKNMAYIFRHVKVVKL